MSNIIFAAIDSSGPDFFVRDSVAHSGLVFETDYWADENAPSPLTCIDLQREDVQKLVNALQRWLA